MVLARHAASLALVASVGCGGNPTASAGAKRDTQVDADASIDPLAGDPLSGAAIMAEVSEMCSTRLAGRGSFQPGGVLAADLVAAAFVAAGLEVTRQPIAGGAENIIGVKAGTNSRGQPKAVIVSAHYDHLGIGASGQMYPGADDNASGTAVLLAIARALSDVPTRHAIVFIGFGAEEVGLVGSGVYIDAPTVPLADTLAVVNFDMVGRNFFESGADTPDTAAVVGLEDSERARELTRAAADRAGLRLIEAPARLLELFRLENRTDDWWFRRVGVLAIHFSTGLHDDYHRTTDTPDKLVPSQLEKIARTAAGLVRALAE